MDSFSVVFSALRKKRMRSNSIHGSPPVRSKKDPPIGRCWGETFGGLTEKGGRKKRRSQTAWRLPVKKKKKGKRVRTKSSRRVYRRVESTNGDERQVQEGGPHRMSFVFKPRVGDCLSTRAKKKKKREKIWRSASAVFGQYHLLSHVFYTYTTTRLGLR